MPQPTISDVHVDSVLTNVSVAFMQEQDAFIADKVFPIVPVQKQSDKYFVYDRSFWYRSEMKKRAPGTESAGGGFELTTASYSADVWALHKDLDSQTLANSDVDLERDSTEWLSLQALLRKDKSWIASYFTTGLWTGDQTGVAAAPGANQFLQFDQTTSNPFVTIRAQILAIQQRTGYRPNTLVIGPQVYNVLVDHATLLDRIKYTERGIVGADLIAAALGIDRVVVALGIENTAVEGATPSYSYLAGKAMLLVYAAPRASLLTPSGGYTFTWTGLEGAGAFGANISTIEMPWIKSERVELEIAYDQKLVSADMGVFFTAVIA